MTGGLSLSWRIACLLLHAACRFLIYAIPRNNFSKKWNVCTPEMKFLFIKFEVLFCILVVPFIAFCHDQSYHHHNLQLEYYQPYKIHYAVLEYFVFLPLEHVTI